MVHSLRDKWGKVPLCNEKPERAPHIGKFCFPLCWRCLMIIIGLLTGSAICIFAYPGFLLCLLASILVVPCLIDGLIQAKTDYVSTNVKRITFGYMAGIGMFLSLYAICVQFLSL